MCIRDRVALERLGIIARRAHRSCRLVTEVLPVIVQECQRLCEGVYYFRYHDGSHGGWEARSKWAAPVTYSPPMPLRRAHLGSLLVVVLALAGATVAPSRACSRAEMSIAWAAGDARVAPAQVTPAPRHVVTEPTQPLRTAVSRPRAVDAPLRHSLFQRPPPLSSRTRIR